MRKEFSSGSKRHYIATGIIPRIKPLKLYDNKTLQVNHFERWIPHFASLLGNPSNCNVIPTKYPLFPSFPVARETAAELFNMADCLPHFDQHSRQTSRYIYIYISMYFSVGKISASLYPCLKHLKNRVLSAFTWWKRREPPICIPCVQFFTIEHNYLAFFCSDLI